MRVYQYWAAGRIRTDDKYDLCLWRGSNNSLEHAQQLADQAVSQLERRPRSELRERNAGSDYSYHTRHVPEELISSFPANDGSMLAAVTRNRYGALVLNTADMVIIDADIEFPNSRAFHSTSSGVLGWLFGGKSTADLAKEKKLAMQNAVDLRLHQIRETAQKYPQHSFRIYRTHSGYRIVLLDQRVSPNAPFAIDLLRQFKSDLNYRNLCRVQASYRARLTPKPHNLQMAYPPFKYLADEGQESAIEDWERKYETASLNFRVCQQVAEIGENQMNPEVKFLLDLHDKACRVSTGLPLA